MKVKSIKLRGHMPEVIASTIHLFKRYAIDDLLNVNILRLLPYNLELNPSELV